MVAAKSSATRPGVAVVAMVVAPAMSTAHPLFKSKHKTPFKLS
jgi:hypothetical protein